MKNARFLGTRNTGIKPDSQSETHNPQDLNPDDSDASISKETVKKKPTRISNKGFTAWIRRIRPTENGVESEVEEPLIIAKSGHRVKDSEIKGQCEVCGGYNSHIFNCYVHGCKKSLCLKHVYFFKQGDKETPYCLEHYRQVIDEFDTWQAYEDRQKLRQRDGKQF